MSSQQEGAARQRAALALGVALVLVVIWGINFSLQKFVFNVIGPGGFLFARYLIMPVCALALLLWRYGRHFPKITRREFWQLARLGVAGHFLHVGMVTYG
ncbi:MAG: hypothetical protein V4711_00915, partial [Pseudomonadota bacterium]